MMVQKEALIGATAACVETRAVADRANSAVSTAYPVFNPLGRDSSAQNLRNARSTSSSNFSDTSSPALSRRVRMARMIGRGVSRPFAEAERESGRADKRAPLRRVADFRTKAPPGARDTDLRGCRR